MKFLKLLVSGVFILGLPITMASTMTSVLAQAPAKISSVQTNMSIQYPAKVLELFTSQGCSSCPKANKFVRSISGDPDVLTLSFGVDYWDYLGWKDTFSKPEFTKRQRYYGAHFQGQVYTPQMIVNGKMHSPRMSRNKLRGAAKIKADTDLQITKNGNAIDIIINGKAGSVMAIYYQPGIHSVSVKRGENRGREISLANVVTKCSEIFARKKPGTYKLSAKLPPAGKALAILVQGERGGPVLAAATYAP